MKKQSTDTQNIYHASEKTPEAAASGRPVSELLEREIRRHFFFNLFAGIFAVLLIGGLIAALVSNYTIVPEKPVPVLSNNRYVEAYTLPTEEQWAIQYHKAAYQADRESPGKREFSTKWVKNTAYHCIMGEQALLMDDPAAAQTHLEAALATFPELSGIHRALGTAYLKRKLYQKAAGQLQEALKEHPSVDVFNNLGVAYFGLDQYEQAEQFLQKAIERQPDLAGGQKNLALLYQKTGRDQEAEIAFRKYFELNPQDTQQLQAYVTALMTTGRAGDAIVFLQDIKGAEPLAVHLMLAKAAAQEDNVEMAVRELREATGFLTPSKAIAEMHDAAFEQIAGTETFTALMYQLELAEVSHSGSLKEPGKEP